MSTVCVPVCEYKKCPNQSQSCDNSLLLLDISNSTYIGFMVLLKIRLKAEKQKYKLHPNFEKGLPKFYKSECISDLNSHSSASQLMFA